MLKRGKAGQQNVLYLHNLSEAALANYLEKLEIVNRQAILAVLDEVDSDLHRPTAKLHGDPVRTSLTLRALSGLFICPLFLEAWMDLERTNEDVLIAACVGR